jgi:hypothetical protein
VVEGRTNNSDLKAFAKLAKQYCGYYYARAHRGAGLWQKGMNDHIIRDDVDLLERVRYVVNNPVAAGLVARPEDYPFLGSQRWSIAELIEWCQRRTKGSSSNDGRSSLRSVFLPPKGGRIQPPHQQDVPGRAASEDNGDAGLSGDEHGDPDAHGVRRSTLTSYLCGLRALRVMYVRDCRD